MYNLPRPTCKLIYYSMFQSTVLLSLIYSRRATKSCSHQLEVLQNRFKRASLFLLKTTTTNLLYFKFQVLKLKDMVKTEIAKFMFRFKNKMLPISFNNYLTNFSEVHKYNIRQKAKSGYYHQSFNSKFGRKRLNHCRIVRFSSLLSHYIVTSLSLRIPTCVTAYVVIVCLFSVTSYSVAQHVL